MLLLLPLQKPLGVLVDDAKHKARIQDKELAADGGYSPADWSKAKSGQRSMDLHRIVKMPDDFQRELYTGLLEALPPVAGRDLVADLIGRVDQLLSVMQPRRAVRAELRDTNDQQKRSA